MKAFLTAICLPLLLVQTGPWRKVQEKSFKIYYKDSDRSQLSQYIAFAKKGSRSVKSFFGSYHPNPFNIYIHPDRKSLDSTWKHDWKMPDFKSECWMAASGVADRLDMIAPLKWDKETCEHSYKDKAIVQQLITHELVHVYHGQLNKSPDFSEIQGIDWFVEGLATFASGQLDAKRMEQLQTAYKENKLPASLQNFWKGKFRYALSGSLVQYIDKKWGRKKLITLLPLSKNTEILKALNVTEAELINEWKEGLRG